MPFTLSHAAVIYPLRKFKIKVSSTALIAGAIAPDFESFLQLRDSNNPGHYWKDLWWFDIPVGLLLCIIYQSLLKKTFTDNLPVVFKKRLQAYRNFNWIDFLAAHPIVVFVSLLTGCVSHLLWDGFTHKGGVFVILLPFLQREFTLLGHTFPFYFFLQVISSIGGLYFFYRWIMQMPVDIDNDYRQHRSLYFPLLLLISASLFTLSLLFIPGHINNLDLIKASFGAFIYGWIITSILYKFG